MKSTALSFRDSSADRPLRTVAKPEPERLDCTAWLTTKLAAGPCWLAQLPQEWAERNDWKTGDHKGATALMEQFIAAQKSLRAVGEWDEQGQRFVLRYRAETEELL